MDKMNAFGEGLTVAPESEEYEMSRRFEESEKRDRKLIEHGDVSFKIDGSTEIRRLVGKLEAIEPNIVKLLTVGEKDNLIEKVVKNLSIELKELKPKTRVKTSSYSITPRTREIYHKANKLLSNYLFDATCLPLYICSELAFETFKIPKEFLEKDMF